MNFTKLKHSSLELVSRNTGNKENYYFLLFLLLENNGYKKHIIGQLLHFLRTENNYRDVTRDLHINMI